MRAKSDNRSLIAIFCREGRSRASPSGARSTATERAAGGLPEAELQAYVDDALGPAGQARLGAYLAVHPAEATRVASYVRQKHMMRRLLGGFPTEVRPDIAHSSRRLARPAVRAAPPGVARIFRKPVPE